LSNFASTMNWVAEKSWLIIMSTQPAVVVDGALLESSSGKSLGDIATKPSPISTNRIEA